MKFRMTTQAFIDGVRDPSDIEEVTEVMYPEVPFYDFRCVKVEHVDNPAGPDYTFEGSSDNINDLVNFIMEISGDPFDNSLMTNIKEAQEDAMIYGGSLFGHLLKRDKERLMSYFEDNRFEILE